ARRAENPLHHRRVPGRSRSPHVVKLAFTSFGCQVFINTDRLGLARPAGSTAAGCVAENTDTAASFLLWKEAPTEGAAPAGRITIGHDHPPDPRSPHANISTQLITCYSVVRLPA